jgi:hypothetical protein
LGNKNTLKEKVKSNPNKLRWLSQQRNFKNKTLYPYSNNENFKEKEKEKHLK